MTDRPVMPPERQDWYLQCVMGKGLDAFYVVYAKVFPDVIVKHEGREKTFANFVASAKALQVGQGAKDYCELKFGPMLLYFEHEGVVMVVREKVKCFVTKKELTDESSRAENERTKARISQRAEGITANFFRSVRIGQGSPKHTAGGHDVRLKRK